MKKLKIQKAIRLDKFVIRELKYNSSLEPGDAPQGTTMKLDKQIEALPDSARYFSVKFEFVLRDNEKTLNIEIKAEAVFESNVDVNDEFFRTDIARINSPAIAFPLLRSFVNTLAVNAGASQIILPIVNFAR